MTFLIIDANSIVNRAFYGIRALSNKKGVFTNAVTGFFNILLKLQNEFHPDCIAAAFDMKAPTFRHKMYDGYKSTRKPMPEELAMQLPYVRRILGAMGIAVVEREGWEADDIIGTLSHAAELSGCGCVISTGDRDSFQLITDRISVNLAGNKSDILYSPDKIMEIYGVSPRQMLEVKALMGDASDNIPGVKGVGEKTALDLIKKYSDINNIYNKIDELEITPSLRKKLIDGKESCFLSRKLGEISFEAPIETDPKMYIPKQKDEQLLAVILTDLEMFSFLKKLNISASSVNLAAAESLLKDAEPEKNDFDEKGGIVFCENGKIEVSDDGVKKKLLSDEEAKAFLAGGENKNSFDLKALYAYAMEKGFEVKNVGFDTTLAAYLINVNSSDYSEQRLFSEYGADNVRSLNEKLMKKITAQELTYILKEIEMPLAEVLSSMERDGVSLDLEGLRAFGTELKGKISETEREIYDLAGEEFNISSPKQLGSVLFEKLNLPNGKKTKTGYSTNADVLEFLADKHPIVNLILRYREYTKLYSTYVVGLENAVCEDGRVRSTFKQTETRTGRISSADPNIQNIPVRKELGKNMRRFFTAKDGCLLVDADYSQIELRVLAHLAGDKLMQNSFINGEDIHAITASQVFNQPLEWVTPELRSRAKAVNFGIVYGIGAFSLSKDINVSVAEAKSYIDAYLSKYSGVDAFMKRTVEDAKKNLYVSTMFGRRRYVPEINAGNKNVQAAAGRIAMNTPIQGTAADIIKLAMIRVYNRLKEEKLAARLILQVHDELIVEAEENCAQRAAEILKSEMESCVKLDVPLVADVKTGKTWFDAH